MTPKTTIDCIKLRGRKFTLADINKIKRLVKLHSKSGRTRISIEICKALQWKQPNGWLKDRACRDVLLHLEKAKVIRLPMRKVEIDNSRLVHVRDEIDQWLGSAPITEMPKELLLVPAKGDESEKIWNHIVAKHHYLGHRVIVGRCLKFLVYSGNQIVAALSLSDAAWAVEDRDRALGKLGINRSSIANNSRFLILPNVRVKNLASRILSLFSAEAPAIWEAYYSTKLSCLETYVDTVRFEGISYRAANWIGVGLSKGYRKIGKTHSNSQTQKFIFLYPLSKDVRESLRATKD